ncbi:chemotaxis protein CheA [Shewanella youngdeokensis]|uniref:Chemotaxis protein CheA n=1 Tax=Shewanella youngdeokensis TaxID=2999068 RepID=A0ABZ0K0Z4_9GAMM|nr:chemotaxis protein CheA [Shewanella sp. DAU334]
MPDNSQQFDKIFFEEMTEHLEETESLLLDMNENDDNSDAFDAIFRAAHSIKGGAGIFGFDDITSVTHILENLLDKLRHDEIQLTQTMLDAFLEAKDLLESLKNVYQYDEACVDPASINLLCNKLNVLCQEPGPDASQSSTALAADANANVVASLSDESRISLKLLLVEDSKVNQMVAMLTLKKLGFTQVEVAKDGQHTLDVLNAAETPFDVILLDCQMPIMDGYQAAQAIRKGEGGAQHSDIAIIAMTAMAGEKEIQNCLQAGMDDYLCKPINAELVDEKISYWYHKKLAPGQSQAQTDTTELGTEAESPIATQVVVSAPAGNKTRAKTAASKKQPQQNETTSIRVSTQKVDQLINQVGELIITQSMLQKLTHDLGFDEHELFAARLKQLESNTRDLQASVMSVRMMPIGTVFGRFPRIIRDLSTQLNKNIKLVIEGEQTELDKGLIEMLAAPLTHLVRNSVDHGIEQPATRQAEHKPAEGVIKLSAFYRGGDVIINVEDDGAGIDPAKILAKARNNGLTLPDGMSNAEIYQLVFSAGFSTAQTVTEISGRGVGMDVVKRNITNMGGRVEISSVLGQGSTTSIQLPLTLAILEGMSVSVGEHIYIIPLTFIVESLQPKAENVKVLNGGGKMVLVHGEYIPVLTLHSFFNIDTDITAMHEGIVILLEHDKKVIALFVDSLVGQQQVVLKNLENNFRKVPCVSGATIMGDGRVSLILDVAELIEQC